MLIFNYSPLGVCGTFTTLSSFENQFHNWFFCATKTFKQQMVGFHRKMLIEFQCAKSEGNCDFQNSHGPLRIKKYLPQNPKTWMVHIILFKRSSRTPGCKFWRRKFRLLHFHPSQLHPFVWREGSNTSTGWAVLAIHLLLFPPITTELANVWIGMYGYVW